MRKRLLLLALFYCVNWLFGVEGTHVLSGSFIGEREYKLSFEMIYEKEFSLKKNFSISIGNPLINCLLKPALTTRVRVLNKK